jgi:hypothetical protein
MHDLKNNAKVLKSIVKGNTKKTTLNLDGKVVTIKTPAFMGLKVRKLNPKRSKN